jgi:hypothetical protein
MSSLLAGVLATADTVYGIIGRAHQLAVHGDEANALAALAAVAELIADERPALDLMRLAQANAERAAPARPLTVAAPRAVEGQQRPALTPANTNHPEPDPPLTA